jgi:hypothetical protein
VRAVLHLGAAARGGPQQRRDFLNDFLGHVLTLARAGPDTAQTARNFLETAYDPLANAAWQYDSEFGFTNVPVDLMEQFVSTQVYALRPTTRAARRTASASRGRRGTRPASRSRS